MTNVTYRELSADDAEAFRAMRIEASLNSPASLYPHPEELTQMTLCELEEQIAPTPFQSVYGAYLRGELVGIAGARREPLRKIKHRALIWGVYVKASHRGQRIARGLLRVLMDNLQATREVSRVYLSVHSQNIAAGCGYQRNSLLVDGEYVDEELMELTLSESESVSPP